MAEIGSNKPNLKPSNGLEPLVESYVIEGSARHASQRFKRSNKTSVTPPASIASGKLGEMDVLIHSAEAQEAVDAFLANMKRLRKAEGTLVRYAPTLAHFAAFVDGQGKTLRELRGIDLETWLREWEFTFQDRNGREPSASSTKNAISAIKSLFDYLERREMIDRNPTKVLEAPRVEQRVNDWLSPAEDQSILDAPKTRQEVIVIYLLRFTGLRIREAVNLKWNDIDFEAGTIRVQVSKTARGRRLIPIMHELRPELRRWKEFQDARGLYAPNAYVLATRNGKRTIPGYLWKTVKRVARNAGVRVQEAGPDNHSEVSPHTLRRTFGSSLLNQGVRLEVVSRLLGHETTQTSERAYATLLDSTIAAEALGL